MSTSYPSPSRESNSIPPISKYSFDFGSGLDLDLAHFGENDARVGSINGNGHGLNGGAGVQDSGNGGSILGLGGMELGQPLSLGKPIIMQAASGSRSPHLNGESSTPARPNHPGHEEGSGRLDEDVDAVLDGRREIGVKEVEAYGKENVTIHDTQFFPDPTVPPKINPLFQLSQSASNSSSSDPSSSRSTPGEASEFASSINGNGYGYALNEVKPAVHIKKVGKDSVVLVADEEIVQRSGMVVEEIPAEKGRRSGTGIIGRVFGKGRKHDGRGHGHDSDDPHRGRTVDETDVPNRIGERHQNSLGIDGHSATPQSNRHTSGSDFRPSEVDELSTRGGPAPPSPPISSQNDHDDAEEELDVYPVDGPLVASPRSEGGSMDNRILQHDMDDRPLNRQVSISGQSFTEEPESLLDGDEGDHAVEGGRLTQERMGEGSTELGIVPEPKGPSTNTSPVDYDGDSRSSHSHYPAFNARAGAIRSGSIAASRARTPAKGTGSSNTVASAARTVSPTMDKKTLDKTLDSKEPGIPSQGERPPVATPAVPIPIGTGSTAAAGPQPGHGGSYFATSAGTTLSPDAANHLHPSSASFISTVSANSSNHVVVPPSSPYNPMTNKLERRSTSASVNQASGSSPRSPLLKSYSQIGLPGHPSPPSLASLRKATQTEVPGLQGSALDPDILAEAERLRQSRLSRRQKKRDSSDDPHTMILSVSPEPAEAHRAPLSPGIPIGDEFMAPRVSPMRRMSEREKEVRENLPGNMEMEKVMVGNLIGEDHVNYVLMYNMLTGIRIGVSRCQAKMKRPLSAEDFTAKHKYSFDIVGNELTPSARYDFKFKDYAPWVFRELREDYFHLDPADYLLSLTAKYILSELGSPGKSGSFFYFSRDYRFIIKTIHHAEHKYLRSILKDYYEHIRSNPHTLLSRFYGLHRVKLPRGRKIHFVIMNNLFPPHRDIHETYDLKGSAIGREYSEEKAKTNPKATLKDLNWVRRGRIFELGPEKRTLFAEQVRRDMELLKKIGVMDYSLLIGIHNMERGNRDNIRENQLSVFHPDVNTLVRRKPSSVKGNAEAQAMRKAVRRSDPKALTSATAELPTSDSADRRHFLFYQDEGGLRATDEANEALDVIYYLGVIDILTPYNTVKQLEHFWRSLTVKDRHMVSCVPPDEYGNRFLAFLASFFRDSDVSLRPRMEFKTKAEEKEESKPKLE